MAEPRKDTPKFVIICVGLAILAFTYFYPRLLVDWLEESNPWTSYLYQYGFGLVCFLVGLFVILKTRACQFGRGRDSFWFGVLLAGFVGFSTLHALWIIAAQHIPYKGE